VFVKLSNSLLHWNTGCISKLRNDCLNNKCANQN